MLMGNVKSDSSFSSKVDPFLAKVLKKEKNVNYFDASFDVIEAARFVSGFRHQLDHC